MFVKLIGAAFIMLSGMFLITKLRYEASERISELEAFLKIVDSVKTDILFKKLPVSKCFANIEIENKKAKDFIGKILNYLEIGKDIPTSVNKALENSDLYLKGEELIIVKSFFEKLGQTSYENQLENAMYTIERLTRRLGEIKKDSEKNEKTQCSLVFGITLTTVIVLC